MSLIRHLREIDVTHPGAKTMMELSRAQDEEVGAQILQNVVVRCPLRLGMALRLL